MRIVFFKGGIWGFRVYEWKPQLAVITGITLSFPYDGDFVECAVSAFSIYVRSYKSDTHGDWVGSKTGEHIHMEKISERFLLNGS